MLVIVIALLITTASAQWDNREDLLEYERSLRIGAGIKLNAKEEAVNAILMGAKLTELDAGFEDPGKLLAAQHFFFAKSAIEQSDVFKFIRRLPKGALLHAHDSAMASDNYVFNLTYWDGLYGCTLNGNLLLHFIPDERCDWKLVSELRQGENFDDWMRAQMTLIVDDPHTTYPHVNAVWSIFMNKFDCIDGLYTYEPVFRDYFRQVLQELYDDNVMYAEFRGTLPDLYDLDGNTYEDEEVAAIYIDVLKDFIITHPDFIGVRYIYAPLRNVDNSTMSEYLSIAKILISEYPEFIAGFDLVGQEDLGRPLIEFIELLKNVSMDTFYHAGETNWNGASTDLNVIDAILLKTKRIGHGYAIAKHPAVLEYVKENSVAMEINPISNQVLKLVEDLRNHPAVYYFANNFPVVISNDDPSFWGSEALSYDWYYAFMAFTSKEGDLKVLKQLALNSLNYSSLDAQNKSSAIEKWQKRWDQFLDDVLNDL